MTGAAQAQLGIGGAMRGAREDRRARWARPGGSYDARVRFTRFLLPAAIAVLGGALLITPLAKRPEASFILNKDKVAVASDRMRVAEALYRGQDSKGRPFSLNAGAAVQRTSRVPVVELENLSARIMLAEGPAIIRTSKAAYDMNRETVRASGPLLFESADGYRLVARGVGVDLKTQTLSSEGSVDGRMPLGTFSGGRIRADLQARTVTLDRGARLHIVQGAIK
jgi:lipopolysaccharide export system protein LptC